MPKKSTPARGGAQRNKPRAQKSFELVRPASEKLTLEEQYDSVPTSEEVTSEEHYDAVPALISTTATTSAAEDRGTSTLKTERTPKTERPSRAEKVNAASKESATAIATEVAEPVKEVRQEKEPVEVVSSKRSAATSLAARRQATQKTPIRSANSLITAEHYSYVRKDLVFIAVLAVIMIATLIILYFVPGIGGAGA